MFATPKKPIQSRIGPLTEEPTWLREAGELVDASPAKFPDLSMEPSWLKSAGRAASRLSPKATPKHFAFTDEEIFERIKKHRSCRSARCAAYTKAGAHCKNCARERSKYCVVHGRSKSKSKK